MGSSKEKVNNGEKNKQKINGKKRNIHNISSVKKFPDLLIWGLSKNYRCYRKKKNPSSIRIFFFFYHLAEDGRALLNEVGSSKNFACLWFSPSPWDR